MVATNAKPINPLWIVSTGKSATQCATQVINPAGNRITKIIACVSHGAIGEMSAAINPSTVIGATAGAAIKLAITLIGDKYPESDTRIGAQKTMAAIGGASAPANFWWVGSFSSIRGARSSKPAVANTDRAKPASRACHGSPKTTAQIAKPRAGKESEARLPN